MRDNLIYISLGYRDSCMSSLKKDWDKARTKAIHTIIGVTCTKGEKWSECRNNAIDMVRIFTGGRDEVMRAQIEGLNRLTELIEKLQKRD